MANRIKTSMPTIRRAAANDARAISALIRRNADVVLSTHYTAEQLNAWKRYNTETRIRDRLAERTTLVAVLSGRLCGTIALQDSELVGMYVSPTERGNGIGISLLEHLESLAAAKGISRLHLTTTPAALDFYLHNGWRAGKVVVLNILGADFEETAMSKRLKPKSGTTSV